MSHTRTSRLRLTAAVLTVAAATAVTGTLPVAPAVAVTAPAAQQAAASDVAPFPADGSLVSAGATGFLAKAGTSGTPYFWTGYDGKVTQLPGSTYYGAAGTDTIVQAENGTYTLYDMGTGADPVVITTPGTLRGVVGSTLVMADTQANEIHLVNKAGDEVVSRTVTGLPSGTLHVRSVGAGVFTAEADSVLALVDVDTAKVLTQATADNSILGFEAVAGSPTHLAWYDYTPADDGGTFHLRDLRTGQTVPVPEGNGASAPALSKDWLALLNVRDPQTAGRPLVLHSLADGRTLRVLDRADEVRTGADGSFLVRGDLAREEGIYRVSVGADGTPTAELVASSGRLADLAVTREQMPTVINFDSDGDQANLVWEFNHPVSVSLTLTHTATGKQLSPIDSGGPQTAYHRFFLNSDGGWYDVAAYSGTYTWKMTATETNDVGPSVERTGTFTINRPPAARDHDANGAADLLVRDSAGQLAAYDVKRLRNMLSYMKPESTVLGTGWNTYTLMAAPGDLGGSRANDIVGRDRDGVLWLHRGDQQKLLPRTKVGGGWQVYNKITGGSDLNGDGRGDLLATDASGVLWFYASTGNATAPFKARKRIGSGWGIYNLLAAPGNIAGASGGDLLARDRDGVLWLYLGKGDGTFTARRKVGGGWGGFTHLAPFGDKNKDGRTDLYATGSAGSRFYQASGSADRPFLPAEKLPLRSDTTFKTVF